MKVYRFKVATSTAHRGELECEILVVGAVNMDEALRHLGRDDSIEQIELLEEVVTLVGPKSFILEGQR